MGFTEAERLSSAAFEATAAFATAKVSDGSNDTRQRVVSCLCANPRRLNQATA